MKYFYASICLLLMACRPEYNPDNEKLVLAFQTETGKHVVVAQGINPSYLVFRYGNDQNLELEFPAKSENSWERFQFILFRDSDGKTDNDAKDFFLEFNQDYKKYSLYEYNCFDPNKPSVYGLEVRDLNGKLISNEKAIPSSIKGSFKEESFFKKIQTGFAEDLIKGF